MRSIVFLAVALLSPLALEAEWMRAGLYGADVRALVVDGADPDLLFLGTSQGEVYRSTDGGASWTATRRSIPFPGYVVDNLIIDGRGHLWAAGWGLWGGGVVAVSEDQGATWSRRDRGLEEVSVRALAVEETNPDVVVAGGLTGVYRSLDAGRSWKKISDQVNVESVAIDPRSADTIYVGTWRQAWRTDDGGRSWKHIAQGMVLDTDVFAINIDPKNPDDVWLSTCGWVYNSLDRGDTWTRYKDGFDNRRIHTIARDPENPDVLYAGSVAGLYTTSDRGKVWSRVSDDAMVINGIVTHPKRPDRIVLATEGDGIYVSNDRGKTFERSSRGLFNVRVANVVPDPKAEGTIYATVFFGNSASGVYSSRDGGSSWEKLNATKLPEVLSLLVRDDDEVRFLAGTQEGFYWSRDGREWTRGEPSLEPLRVDRMVEFSPRRLFAATAAGVYTSRDGGKQWYRLGPAERVSDVALGRAGGQPVLYALTARALLAFDGKEWRGLAEAPAQGKMLAIRNEGNRDLVLVAGSKGVEAGWVDGVWRWTPAPAPKGDNASAHRAAGSAGTLVVSFGDDHRIHLSERAGGSWRILGVPTNLRDIAGVAIDPFRSKRMYVNTHGQGILIHDSTPVTAESPVKPQSAGMTGGGAK